MNEGGQVILDPNGDPIVNYEDFEIRYTSPPNKEGEPDPEMLQENYTLVSVERKKNR